jgi:hypothetical protein
VGDKFHSIGKFLLAKAKKADSLSLMARHLSLLASRNLKTMQKTILILLGVFMCLSCAQPKHLEGKQGIYGQALWLEGNLMPTIDETGDANRSKGQPVKRTVLIYEPTSLQQVEKNDDTSLYKAVNTRLVKTFETDDAGNFRASLKPGKYSVFVREDEGLFSNTFDGKGIIGAVTVVEGEFTEHNIKINYKAFY